MKGKKGVFVTFEGGEGCGKTTQVNRFARELQKRKVPVIKTKEPGGTTVGQKIRKILFQNRRAYPLPKAEVLLFVADRAQHFEEVLRSHLKKGEVVLCDRFLDSTLAYQWAGRGFEKKWLLALHDFATDGFLPDLTFYIDLPPEVGLNRKGRVKNRFDELDLAFHRKVRSGYLKLAQENRERITVVDGSLSPKALFDRMWAIFIQRFGDTLF